MENVIRETFLRADSAKQAFYRLVTEEITDGFLIRKESGIGEGRVLHEETYFRESLRDAIKLHEKKIHEKTNKQSKRKRIYSIILDQSSLRRSESCGKLL